MGVATLAVGCLHFVMMGHLTQWIAQQLDPLAGPGVLAAFRVNHIGSGVFLILLGIIITYSSHRGLRHGKRWARTIALLFGFSLCLLTVILWMSVPDMFLAAAPFRWALVLLGMAGILTSVPAIFFHHHFNEN